jgi:hypothetical protein
MPTLLPNRVPAPAKRNTEEVSPILLIVAAMLALLLVLAEAQASNGGRMWEAFVPPDGNVGLPI